jgi:hypothetical protein
MGHGRDCNSMYGLSWPRVLALNISHVDLKFELGLCCLQFHRSSIFLVSWIWTSYSQHSLI